jgi:hypothetical protein
VCYILGVVAGAAEYVGMCALGLDDGLQLLHISSNLSWQTAAGMLLVQLALTAASSLLPCSQRQEAVVLVIGDRLVIDNVLVTTGRWFELCLRCKSGCHAALV